MGVGCEPSGQRACRYIDEAVVEAVVMDVARVSAARWQVWLGLGLGLGFELGLGLGFELGLGLGLGSPPPGGRSDRARGEHGISRSTDWWWVPGSNGGELQKSHTRQSL